MKRLYSIGIFPIVISLSAMCFGQGSAECNKVDGFTSATEKLNVDSILVYRTYAEVYWWEKYSDSAFVLKYQIEWGTKDSISYTDTLILKPYKQRVRYVSKIQPLKDSTTYFAQFHRDYHGEVVKTKFIFNTPPMANSIRHRKMSWVVPTSKNITGMDVFTVNGRLLSHTDIVKGADFGALKPQVSAPGLYIVNFTGAAGKIVKSEMGLFGR